MLLKSLSALRKATLFSLTALCAFAAVPATALAEDQLLESRTLFMTERFSPSTMRAPLAGPVLPETLVALRGEYEGFQTAINNSTGAPLSLSARVSPDANLTGAATSGVIGYELLRVGMVNVPEASTGSTTGAGTYADPLPPLNVSSAAGQLQVGAGEWGGVATLFKIRTDAPAGLYTGSVELYAGETVYARQPFTLEVKNTTLKQAGDKGSFKTLLGVEGEAYWLQHADMRNRPHGTTNWADRMAQLGGLMSFMDSRGITPVEFQFGNPAKDGRYTCSWTSKGLAAYSFKNQLAHRYFAPLRALDPTKGQFQSRVMPTHTWGCNPDQLSSRYTGLLETGSAARQDDKLHVGAPAFYKRVASTWRTNGWFNGSTYVKNPFDEPSDVTPAFRATMNKEVGKANVAIRKAVGKKAKIFIASWPRDNKRYKICRKKPGGKVGEKLCTNVGSDKYHNRHLWDNKGADDVDIWMPPLARIYGQITPPKLRKDYKYQRDRQYADRLKKIRKSRPGAETWAYNFSTGTSMMPQLYIDAPSTDARLQYWMLAQEGMTGLYVSNSMLGWGNGDAVRKHPSGRVRKSNPYKNVPYFEHKTYGIAAGWGTFIYPGYQPELGLDSETLRNTIGATPVSSFRMEGLRDGQEDANLIAMYRDRFGERAMTTRMKTIFPGTYRNLPRNNGSTTFIVYNNGNNLAQRMESERRQMIAELVG